MSGAGFFLGTISPAKTLKREAVASPTVNRTTASTEGLAEVDATANRQPAANASSANLFTPIRPGTFPDAMIS